MLRRLRKIALSISTLSCAAVLFWGLAGAAQPDHGAGATAASQLAQNHAHDHEHAASAAVGEHHGGVASIAPADADNSAGSADHCSLPGCSFAALTPALFGTVVHALGSASAFAPGEDVPDSGAAPPLRPPRFS